MKSFLLASVLAFICICGLHYILGVCGLVIHNHLINTGVSAIAGVGSLMLASKI